MLTAKITVQATAGSHESAVLLAVASGGMGVPKDT